MAARNTGDDPREISLSKLAVATQFNADAMREYLDDEAHYGKQNRKVKGVKTEVLVRRVVTLNAPVPETLYVAVAQAAYNTPGGQSDADVSSGFIGRATRLPLFTHYNGLAPEAVNEWENARAEAISKARSERMSDTATRMGISRAKLEASLDLITRLKGSKSFLAGLQKSDPDLYEALTAMSDDTES